MKTQIPEPFRRKIKLDKLATLPVVSIQLIKDMRRCRRECQVYIIGGKPTPFGAGSPVAMAASA